MQRRGYVIRRLLFLIPTLLAIYTITFVLIRNTPGGPWDAEKPLRPEVIEMLNKAYGLDRPLWQQYLNYLTNAVQGDFGPSYTQRSRTVSEILAQTFPISFSLGVAAMIVAILIGIPLGILGAIRHNTWVDYIATFTSVVGISTPAYVVCSLLVLFLASYLKWVPTQGWEGIFNSKAIIPASALALYPAAVLARYTRSSLLEVMRTDYVRTARAKGLHESSVIFRHAIKNSLLPVVTVGGIVLADVITGSFFVEVIYNVPGLGRTFVNSISGRDYPVVLGSVLLLGTVITFMNLFVDLMYPLIDPRVSD